MVYAAVNWGSPTVNPVAKYSNIASITNIIAPMLITGGAVLFLVMLIRGAFTLMTAEGSPEKVGTAKKTFGYAILGLVMVLMSYLAVRLIGWILNIESELKPLGL